MIQARTRVLPSRRALLTAIGAATTLQSVARMAAAVGCLAQARGAATTLQAAARRGLARRSLARARSAQVAVASAARRMLARNLARRHRAARAVQAVARGRLARTLAAAVGAVRRCQAWRRGCLARRHLAAALGAARVLRREFFLYRARCACRRAAVAIQRAVRHRQSTGDFAGRRALLHACYGLDRFTSSVGACIDACATLEAACAHPTARMIVLDVGVVAPLLRTIGSCNRSPPCLILLGSALVTLRQLVADAACLPRVTTPMAAHFAAVLLKVLVSHWGSSTHFALAARCLLHASGDATLRDELQLRAPKNKGLVCTRPRPPPPPRPPRPRACTRTTRRMAAPSRRCRRRRCSSASRRSSTPRGAPRAPSEVSLEGNLGRVMGWVGVGDWESKVSVRGTHDGAHVWACCDLEARALVCLARSAEWDDVPMRRRLDHDA